MSQSIDPWIWENSGRDTGYEIVGGINLDTSLMYAYEELRFYRRKSDGAIFGAFDAGCSCPEPFEMVTEADLTPIRSARDFRRYLNEYKGEYTSTSDVLEMEKFFTKKKDS